MQPLKRFLTRLWNFAAGRRGDARLREEIEEHLALQTEENIRRGMAAAEGRRQAVLKFGAIAGARERYHAEEGLPMLESVLGDARYALRQFRKAPGFTLVVILTLTLGLGMSTAIFSVLRSLELHALPYRNAAQLVWLADFDRFYDSASDHWVPRADYLFWRDQANLFQELAAYGNEDVSMIVDGRADHERIASVTGDYWSITGAKPLLGKLFKSDDTQVAVLSNETYKEKYRSDPRVIGQVIKLNGLSFTVVGVLPPTDNFVLPQQMLPGETAESIAAYIPIPDGLLRLPVTSKEWDVLADQLGPAPNAVCIVGKMRADTSFTLLRQRVQSSYRRLVHDNPTEHYLHTGVRLIRLRDKLIGAARKNLVILSVAVGVLLVIAILNVVNLILARAASRGKEIAVRAALGATRSQISRQFVLENLLLSCAGGIGGLVLAHWCISLMVKLWSSAVPHLAETEMDWAVLAFTVSLSSIIGIIVGSFPAMIAWKRDLAPVLQNNTQTSVSSRSQVRTQKWMVVAEIGLSVVLSAGAGLLIQSFRQLNSYFPGFTPNKILTMRVSLSGAQYGQWPAQAGYINRLLDRLKNAPGVTAVGIAGGTLHTNIRLEGLAPGPSDRTSTAVKAVSAGYFKAIGLPLLAGSWPTEASFRDGVLVNDSFVRQMGRGNGILGRKVIGGYISEPIIGIVADFKSTQLEAESTPELYASYELAPLMRPMSARVYVATSGKADAYADSIAKMVTMIDPSQPVSEVGPLSGALSESIAPRRFNLFLLSAFAFASLVLAVVGVYGVVSYSASRRTREVAVRMAIGANRMQVLGTMLREGMVLVGCGLITGTITALFLTRFISSLLFGIKANDLATFATVMVVIVTTSFIACSIPSLRAASADPVSILREE